ncbi:MAG: malonate decarboxylase subunit delta [Alcaligenaceae bacterium]|nr:malonate decarboxylase subunit delta [Alcaligenaceae bacterium]
METLTFEFQAGTPLRASVRTGVVASGDLEILLSPAPSTLTRVTITTAVNGKKTLWAAVLNRFFDTFPRPAAHIEINDNGATPGVVRLRLEQAFELADHETPYEHTH